MQKIMVRLIFILLFGLLSGCGLFPKQFNDFISYFDLVPSAPISDPNDECNEEIQRIAGLSQVKYPVNSIVQNIEEVLIESFTTWDFKNIFKKTSARYATQVLANGGLRTLLTDINKDAKNQQALNNAVGNLKQCRTNQSRRIAREMQGPNSHKAKQEKEIVLKKAKSENRYISAVNKNFGKRIDLYEETSSEISKKRSNFEVRYITSARMNVRNRPTTRGSSVVGKLSRNDSVSVIEDLGDWLKIDYNGKIAYVAKRYTSSTVGTSVAGSSNVGQAIQTAKKTQKKIDEKNELAFTEISEILASENV